MKESIMMVTVLQSKITTTQKFLSEIIKNIFSLQYDSREIIRL